MDVEAMELNLLIYKMFTYLYDDIYGDGNVDISDTDRKFLNEIRKLIISKTGVRLS